MQAAILWNDTLTHTHDDYHAYASGAPPTKAKHTSHTQNQRRLETHLLMVAMEQADKERNS